MRSRRSSPASNWSHRNISGPISRWQFWAYVAIYGLIALGLVLAVDILIAGQIVRLNGLGVDSPWVRAAIIGITAKSLMKITFFNVGGGLSPTPVGISSIVQIFEPWLLGAIEERAWNGVMKFIKPHADRHADLATVRTEIGNNIPPNISNELRAYIRAQVASAPTVTKAMEIFVTQAGRETLARVFPL